jgi:hypothetical protein
MLKKREEEDGAKTCKFEAFCPSGGSAEVGTDKLRQGRGKYWPRGVQPTTGRETQQG